VRSDMTITIVGIDFDYRDYDERSDVLYLHVGPPNGPAAETLETPEGHTVEYDEQGAIVHGEWETAEESPLHADHVEFAQIWKALPKSPSRCHSRPRLTGGSFE
jgi:uncharacterized protein YuzE